jgi:hypothetical protein
MFLASLINKRTAAAAEGARQARQSLRPPFIGATKLSKRSKKTVTVRMFGRMADYLDASVDSLRHSLVFARENVPYEPTSVTTTFRS